ncbi:MAG: prolyl oligopeptidase family serine peptidase [Deltaproteobacteria bacterium]|nr:prolyl oligopeptidase family serine peptidase [Deltaproteobacteria bacterium]
MRNIRWIVAGLVSACGCGEASNGLGTDGMGASSTGAPPASSDGGGTPTSEGVDSGDGAATSADPATGADSSAGDDGPPPPMACDTASLFEPGTHTRIAVDVDGVSRTYDLFVPTSYDPMALAPLVLNFHGLLGSPSQQASFSQFNGIAEGHSMLVAYPAGIGNSFNAGVCCGQASSSGVDDVGFARALVADVASKMCVDPRRVYATGMSNGGHMAHRLACEAADMFAATASVAGVLSLITPCTPSRPVSMLQFHGTADTIVGYNSVPPVMPMMEAWAARNGCSGQPETTFDQGDIQCQTWPSCNGEVEVSLCTIDGGGHCWPGNESCVFGHSSTELHASEAIATMFDTQLLP